MLSYFYHFAKHSFRQMRPSTVFKDYFKPFRGLERVNTSRELTYYLFADHPTFRTHISSEHCQLSSGKPLAIQYCFESLVQKESLPVGNSYSDRLVITRTSYEASDTPSLTKWHCYHRHRCKSLLPSQQKLFHNSYKF